jgi:hypothetical protein
MQPEHGKSTPWSRAVWVIVGILMPLALACLPGCGNNTVRMLAVADSGNNRVLVYEAPFSTGQSATVVLGQSGPTTATASLTATGMNSPTAIAQDRAGNIYVSDLLNNRVLQFQPP